jgi:twitching motility two-component system response regulator PilG
MMAEADIVNKHVQLREAVTAAKLGQKVLARKLLLEILAVDRNNEEAWLWSAALAESGQEAHRCLLRVLDINPNNNHALNALALQRLREAAQRQQRAHAAMDARAAGDTPTAEAPKPAAPSWHCPLCDAGSAQAVPRCPRCGVLLSLANLDELASNRDVDENTLLEAIQRLLKEVRIAPRFDAHLNIARAYLNLNRSAEALPHLEKALELKPSDAHVRAAFMTLSSRRLILAVDDSLTVRKIVAVTLERQGYRVQTAMDGMQALAKVNEQRPDLILLDITMPRMDGYQVCKTIKQNAYTRQIPVLMLSGKDGFFDKVKGKLAGATDYLTKPFQEETLLKSVEKYLKPRN